MTEAVLRIRGQVLHAGYRHVAKPVFFRIDPVVIHDQMGAVGKTLGSNPLSRSLVRAAFRYEHPMVRQTLAGIGFANPIGLAAGFDKNARLTQVLPSVGFGFEEVGSITARPCAGNAGKRLYRLPKSRSLVVNYGLMNDGAAAIAARLRPLPFAIPIGTSLAPTNDRATADYRNAVEDYCVSYRLLATIGSYTTLNLSCPNTCYDQPFTEPAKLDELLAAVRRIETAKPIFLKLSPDLTFEQVDELLRVAVRHGVAGVICTNLTKRRDPAKIHDAVVPARGGLSGALVGEQSDAMIRHVYRRFGPQLIVVGCGGVFTPDDAYRKIRLGASLIQLVTGMIFEGPQLIGQLNQGLVERLQRDGFRTLAAAVGADA